MGKLNLKSQYQYSGEVPRSKGELLDVLGARVRTVFSGIGRTNQYVIPYAEEHGLFKAPEIVSDVTAPTPGQYPPELSSYPIGDDAGSHVDPGNPAISVEIARQNVYAAIQGKLDD